MYRVKALPCWKAFTVGLACGCEINVAFNNCVVHFIPEKAFEVTNYLSVLFLPRSLLITMLPC